ncbi:hypothetical protein [Schlesneria sp. DSM 10557]|uniref:hypothetical protein n=1 Tax=Schlesneria sp. DSM 10557 TaxID=3044399 RepID=UPI0035A0C839
MIDVTLTTVGTTLSYVAKAARWCGGKGLVWKARDRMTISILQNLHIGVVHECRALTSALQPAPGEVASRIASGLCDRMNDIMRTILELQPNQLHCCIKLIAPKENPTEDDQLGTWARSQPFDDRPVHQEPSKDFHSIDKNTVWCAFYGRNDGVTNWTRVNCFSCNDLLKQAPLFKCDRDNWQQFYQSVMVFPINFAIGSDNRSFSRLGFLAFDSPIQNAFRGMPNIFEYRDSISEYRDRLLDSTCFHFGAICADLLGAAIADAFRSTTQPAVLPVVKPTPNHRSHHPNPKKRRRR